LFTNVNVQIRDLRAWHNHHVAQINERIRHEQTMSLMPSTSCGYTWFTAGNNGVDGWIGQLSADVPTLQLRKIRETSNTMRCHADVLDSNKRGVSGMASC
jgi:hypothetical protein